MMARRVPVLSQNNVLECRSDAVNDLDDFVAPSDRERAARAKIILNVDDHKSVEGGCLHSARASYFTISKS